MPGDSGVLVVTRVRSTTIIAHETAGAAGIRHSPRPLLGGRFINASGAWRREVVKPYPKLGVPSLRAKRSNPPFLSVVLWIASRSLSSGAHSRDPFARNDELRTATVRDRVN